MFLNILHIITELLPSRSHIVLSLTLLKYLYYPVLGQQAGPLGGRVLVHSSDVLARPCPLAVQVEAISIRPSLDHAETWPKFGGHLLEEWRGERKQIQCVNTLYVTCLNRLIHTLLKVPPPWVCAQEEQEAQRLRRAPVIR